MKTSRFHWRDVVHWLVMFVAKSVGLHQNEFLLPLFASSLGLARRVSLSQNFTTLTFSSQKVVPNVPPVPVLGVHVRATSNVNFQFCGSSVASQISKMGRTGKKRKEVSVTFRAIL